MTYFEMINLTHKPKLVAVTSCGAGAGVTTTAAGLATSLSETGDGNVLLVNMNVRDSEAHRFYKGKLACGMEEVLEKETRHDALVQDHLMSPGNPMPMKPPAGVAQAIQPPGAEDEGQRLRLHHFRHASRESDQHHAAPGAVYGHGPAGGRIREDRPGSRQTRRQPLGETKANIGVVLNKSRDLPAPASATRYLTPQARRIGDSRRRPAASHAMEFIDLKEQYRRYKAEMDGRILRVLAHGQFVMGPEVAELEHALAQDVGVNHCISVASGTASLEIALRALGIGPGDEVVTVPYTWISTAEVIALVGARPVFVDIEAATYNIDIDLIEAAITSKTQAILPVSLFGQMPDYDRINAIAARHHLPVIEDGAQSFGATQRGRRSCGVTTVGSTSFFPAKPLGCYGEGGALFVRDDALADTMRAIRTHGGLHRNHHPLLGTNGRFDTVQAAVLLAKFPHFDWEVRERGRIGARYSAALAGRCGVPEVMAGNTHVYAQYTIRLPDREQWPRASRHKGFRRLSITPSACMSNRFLPCSATTWGIFRSRKTPRGKFSAFRCTPS